MKNAHLVEKIVTMMMMMAVIVKAAISDQLMNLGNQTIMMLGIQKNSFIKLNQFI